MAKEPEGGTDNGADLKSLLEETKKESAGKDRKITGLSAELETLRGELSKAQAAAEGKLDGDVGEVRRLMEIGAELKSRERDLAEKQQALAAAVERGIPINLALRGSGDLDAFLVELEQFGEQVKAGKAKIAASYSRRETRDSVVRKAGAFDLAKLGRDEIARIPSKIMDRLMGGKS